MLHGRLHHIGVVVPSVRDALAAQTTMNGARLFAAANLTAGGGALIAFLERRGEPLLELIEPVGEAGDPRDFLGKHPDGGFTTCATNVPIFTLTGPSLQNGVPPFPARSSSGFSATPSSS